jgi:AcrR family transcriptional regulator
VAVKREYTSELRAGQARETRRLIVAAAARLYVRDGYGVTTIDAIAAAAGVGRKTVFASAGGKAQLLKLALDWAVVGDDEPVPLAQRPEVRAIGRLTDPDAIIGGFVTVVADSARRVAGLSQVLLVAAGIDPEMKALRGEKVGHRLAGARAFVTHLANHGGLRADLDVDTATDIVWVHSDPGLYYRLVIERHWTHQRFTPWLHRTLTVQLRP